MSDDDTFVERRKPNLNLEHSVQELTFSIRELRAELVRKDVYEADQKLHTTALSVIERGVESTVRTVEKIEERRAADKRLLITAFVLPIMLMLFQLYLAAQTGVK